MIWPPVPRREQEKSHRALSSVSPRRSHPRAHAPCLFRFQVSEATSSQASGRAAGSSLAKQARGLRCHLLLGHRSLPVCPTVLVTTHTGRNAAPCHRGTHSRGASPPSRYPPEPLLPVQAVLLRLPCLSPLTSGAPLPRRSATSLVLNPTAKSKPSALGNSERHRIPREPADAWARGPFPDSTFPRLPLHSQPVLPNLLLQTDRPPRPDDEGRPGTCS